MRIKAGLAVIAIVIGIFTGLGAMAAPYAAMVMDARSGEVLHSRNADTKLHPASLTKMMTLYMVFEAVEAGKLDLDQKVKISSKAAAEPPSKLGLKAGQSIKLRYLIRATAVKSANDAATALAELVSGSEANFTRMMTDRARQLGMTKTTFKNAHGLTQAGHLSTARDMTILGRRLFYDFPDYYNLFSRKSTDAGVASVLNTNRRLLGSYKGADGIKTGYTRAAGYNLVASAERGQKRVIATVFGGTSSANRNARVAELLDMGFSRSPNRVAVKIDPVPPANAPSQNTTKVATLVLKAPRAVVESSFPKRRPPEIIAIANVQKTKRKQVEAQILASTKAAIVEAAPIPAVAAKAEPVATIEIVALPAENNAGQSTEDQILKVVSKASSKTDEWGVDLGVFTSRQKAEKVLLRTALADFGALDGALRKVEQDTVDGRIKYRATFVSMSESNASRACERLRARNSDCQPIAPSGNGA
ncbi:MAG: D-alanyl-D-alanine carboxypeptidase family protein [Pseudomonadota bacterium]